jgi:hypothetical protein
MVAGGISAVSTSGGIVRPNLHSQAEYKCIS